MMASTTMFTVAEDAMRNGTKRAARRGSAGRALLPVVLSVVLAGALTGCGQREGDGGSAAQSAGSVDPGGRGITAEDFVSYVAALSVAVEEGLVGEPARLRAQELGAPPLERARVEAFAAGLREDPERWVRTATLIETRVSELRAAQETQPSEAASRPSQGAAP
jgi:hypothetical protein